jgi:hypothetical protein
MTQNDRLSVRVSDDDRKLLKQIADQYGMTESWVLRYLIDLGFVSLGLRKEKPRLMIPTQEKPTTSRREAGKKPARV